MSEPKNYKDANGFVFLDRVEPEPGWVEMTTEETASVIPMNRHERRAWAKWYNKPAQQAPSDGGPDNGSA